MTGAEELCEAVTGTPYVGADQLLIVRADAPAATETHGQPLEGASWTDSASCRCPCSPTT